jgi:hypothetical protein
MRNANTWVRSVLGLGAVLLVAGPGLVMAAFDPSYTPKSLVVSGPGTLANGATGSYTATVTFTNGESATSPTVPVVWSALNGLVTVSGNEATAGAVDGITGIRATYTANNTSVTGSRIIRVQ